MSCHPNTQPRRHTELLLTTLQAEFPLPARTGHRRRLPLTGTGHSPAQTGHMPVVPGLLHAPRNAIYRWGRQSQCEKTGRRKVNRHTAGILGGRVTARGEKTGLSHGSGHSHRGSEARAAGRSHAGLGGEKSFAMCAVASEEAWPLGAWEAELKENRRVSGRARVSIAPS